MKTSVTLIQKPKWVMAAFAAALGLAVSGTARAQYVTGAPTLSNVPPHMMTLYGDWQKAAILDIPTGFEVYAPNGGGDGGGAGYYDIPQAQRQTLNPDDTMALLTFTINDGNTEGSIWLGTDFYLDDNVGSYDVGGYIGEFGGYDGTQSPGSAIWNTVGNTTTVTETVDLPAAMISTIEAGGDTINGITLTYYPAIYGTQDYDVTFNSLELVPEPATMALVGIGLVGFAVLRREKQK